jgi:threonine dehydratase
VLDQRERLAGKRVGVLLTGGNVDLDAIAETFASASRPARA